MIQINFSRDFPIFPLAGLCLLPHARVPLHIFEPRYVAMVEYVIDGSSQIAMATFAGDKWREDYQGTPPVRPAVCIGQIERYEKIPHSRYNIMLQGVCRAKIVEEHLPTNDRPFRTARLTPLETNPDDQEAALVGWRNRVRDLLENEPLSSMRLSESILEWISSDEIPSHVLIELVGHLLMTTAEDAERRYRLLSEPDPIERADYTEAQLMQLGTILRRAGAQKTDWPKGCPLN